MRRARGAVGYHLGNGVVPSVGTFAAPVALVCRTMSRLVHRPDPADSSPAQPSEVGDEPDLVERAVRAVKKVRDGVVNGARTITDVGAATIRARFGPNGEQLAQMVEGSLRTKMLPPPRTEPSTPSLRSNGDLGRVHDRVEVLREFIGRGVKTMPVQSWGDLVETPWEPANRIRAILNRELHASTRWTWKLTDLDGDFAELRSIIDRLRGQSMTAPPPDAEQIAEILKRASLTWKQTLADLIELVDACDGYRAGQA